MSEVNVRTEWTRQELAAEIAGIIRLKTELWDQSGWFYVPGDGWGKLTVADLRALIIEEGNACGSTACVAGWAAVLTSAPGTLIINGGYVQTPDTGSLRSAEYLGMEALQLSQEDADWLFSAVREKAEVLSALDAIASGEDWHRPEPEGCSDPDCMACYPE
jgi:hypothetical protein